MPGYKQPFETCTDASGLGGSAASAPVTPRPARPAPPPAVKTRPNPHLGGLVDAIESEVIPQLLRSLGNVPERAPGPAAAASARGAARRQRPGVIGEETVASFLQALVAGQPLQPLVGDAVRRGASVEQVFRDLLAPTARLLGTQWERDRLHFADVTLAMGRLQQLLRELSHEFLGAARALTPQRSILLAPCPGEQHLFGLLMVGEYFRRAGWDVVTLPVCALDDLVATVRSQWFGVVGLSAGSARRVDALATAVQRVRSTSCNRAVGVLVGGAAVAGQPGLVERVGADLAADDAGEAPYQAEQLITLLAEDNR